MTHTATHAATHTATRTRLTHSLQLRQLGVSKGLQPLFSDIDCSLHGGELLQVAGDNGSGKTSLLRVLAGLSSDYQGEVLWNQQNIRDHWHAYAPQLLYLGHQPALKAQLTAHENLAWYAGIAGADREQVNAALETLGISQKADLPCRQLSAGQQRRVVLARLFFSSQPVWILDEPFTALDPHGFVLIVECLRQHLAKGGMAIFTTHHGSENIDLPLRTLTLENTTLTEQAVP